MTEARPSGPLARRWAARCSCASQPSPILLSHCVREWDTMLIIYLSPSSVPGQQRPSSRDRARPRRRPSRACRPATERVPLVSQAPSSAQQQWPGKDFYCTPGARPLFLTPSSRLPLPRGIQRSAQRSRAHGAHGRAWLAGVLSLLLPPKGPTGKGDRLLQSADIPSYFDSVRLDFLASR